MIILGTSAEQNCVWWVNKLNAKGCWPRWICIRGICCKLLMVDSRLLLWEITKLKKMMTINFDFIQLQLWIDELVRLRKDSNSFYCQVLAEGHQWEVVIPHSLTHNKNHLMKCLWIRLFSHPLLRVQLSSSLTTVYSAFIAIQCLEVVWSMSLMRTQ